MPCLYARRHRLCCLFIIVKSIAKFSTSCNTYSMPFPAHTWWLPFFPVQRHITGVLEHTRVFDEKYPGIFQYPVLWCHITGVLTNTRVFSIKYPGIWQPVKYPGKWQRKQRAVCTGMYPVCWALPISVYRVASSATWMAITERGQAGGGKGQTVSKYRCETIYLKDFEVVKRWRGM